MSPKVNSIEELQELARAISSADFVLAGSLHAAILAAAYKRPFAYWETGHVDVPFKWADFSASIQADVKWVKNIRDGLEAYAEIVDSIQLPALSPILACCPFAVNPAVTVAAAAHDAQWDRLNASNITGVTESALFDFSAHIERERTEDNNRKKIESAAVVRAEKIEKSLSRIDEATRWLFAEMEASRFNFENGHRELVISHRGPGSAFLESGWEVVTDVPWSVAQVAYVRLPESSGWDLGSSLCISGYVLIPPAHLGTQVISVSVNDIPIISEEFLSEGDHQTKYITLNVAIPNLLRRRGGWLDLRFTFSNPRSLDELNAGSDKRSIAFCIERVSLFPIVEDN